MVNFGSLILAQPDGTPQQFEAFRGRPVILQVLRYYG